MPRAGSRNNGGVIGPTNKTSFGKNKVTTTIATGDFTTQPGTTVVNLLVVAGGGAGGTNTSGNVGSAGGGAGGVRQFNCVSVSGNTAFPATIGAGGSATPYPGGSVGGCGADSSITIGCTTYTSNGGGGSPWIVTGKHN